MFSISGNKFSQKRETKSWKRAKKTHFSIVVKFPEFSVFACQHKTKNKDVINNKHIRGTHILTVAVGMQRYQTEGAIFSPQQVGQQARQGGLIPPAPAGGVEVGGHGQVDVRQKASEETNSQRHKNTQRQLLSRLWAKQILNVFQPSACCTYPFP